MRSLGLGQRLKPIGYFVELLVARRLGHAGIHVCVFMRLAGDCSGKIVRRGTNWQTRGRIAGLFEVLKMSMRVTGLAFRR